MRKQNPDLSLSPKFRSELQFVIMTTVVITIKDRVRIGWDIGLGLRGT